MRRLCLDVDLDGTVIGGSVELYDERDGRRYALLVMPEGWADTHDLASAIRDLFESGWMTPPLPFPAALARRPNGSDGVPPLA